MLQGRTINFLAVALLSILILPAFSYGKEKAGDIILIPNGSFGTIDNGDPVGWKRHIYFWT